MSEPHIRLPAETFRLEGEAPYRALFETHPQPLWVFDRETFKCLAVNAAAQDFYGYSEAEFLEMTALDLRPAEDRDEFQAIVRAAGSQPRRSAGWRHTRKNGDVVEVFINAHGIRFGDRPARLVMVQDMTAERRAEQELRDSEERYRTLFDSARDAIFLMDGERFADCNRRASELVGFTRDELVGQTPVHVSPPLQPDNQPSAAKVEPIVRAAMSGVPQHFEWRCRRKDGSEVDVDVSVNAVQVSGRAMLQVVVRDLSARKRAEEERAALQLALLQKQKIESVGRLAGIVAHDFNNLLTVISGYAALVNEEPETTGRARAKIDQILRASERATELTNKLLILSRKHPSEPKVLDVDEFIRQESRLLPGLLGEQVGVQIALNAAPAHVRIDPGQLSHALMNLVLNARDAMGGSGTLTIGTRSEPLDTRRRSLHPGAVDGDYVWISIRDTGAGMTPDVQGHLFEPFFTTKPPGKGTGLGLAIAYGMVQQAHGFIDVETAPGAGTTMTLSLPVSTAAAHASVAEPRRDVRGGSESILIVDDEDTVRELTHTILARLGYRLVAANGPTEAIRLVREGLQFDLVVTDVVMPDMHGGRLVTELQRLATGFQVLYLSGFADTGLLDASELHADAEHFLAKPFNSETLGRKVRALLDKDR